MHCILNAKIFTNVIEKVMTLMSVLRLWLNMFCVIINALLHNITDVSSFDYYFIGNKVAIFLSVKVWIMIKIWQEVESIYILLITFQTPFLNGFTIWTYLDIIFEMIYNTCFITFRNIIRSQCHRKSYFLIVIIEQDV